MHYGIQFEKKRNYIKGTWSLLHKVINHKNANRNQSLTLHINGIGITVMSRILYFLYSNWTCACQRYISV